MPRAAQVRQVSRLDRGACLIRIDGFESLSIAQPYIDAAFALARGATGIVLDLRSNVGGYPETVAYLAGRLLGDKAVKLSEVTYRDHHRQWWTPDLPTGTAGTNWEGRGVAPQVDCAADDAIDAALAHMPILKPR